MYKKEIINKIMGKKEFSRLPEKDVERVFKKFEKRQTSDEEKVKLSRDLLRRIYSVFTSGKLLNKKILDKKKPEDILKKHISTRERFDNYSGLYERLLRDFNDEEISVFDLGAGINGLSYDFFPRRKRINYIGVEAVGQLVELMNCYFDKSKIKNAKAIHGSLFDVGEIKKIVLKSSGKKIIFLFKVVDSLEMFEKNFSKKLLNELVPLVDRIVVSFATRSLVSGKKFSVKRYWFENFVKDNFNLIDDFAFGSERYFIFEKRDRG